MEVFTWQRSTREQGYPVVSYPQSFRIQIQSICTQFEYPWALVLPLSLFTVYTFKPVYDAYCSILPCHVSEVRGEVMDIIRHLTMLHPVATFLYGADWLLQRVTQTPAPDVKSMVQSYFWIKLSLVITFQPPQPVSETSLQALRREWLFAQNYDIMRPWALGTDEISARKSSAITTRLLANHFPNSSQIFFGRETRVVQRWEQTKPLLDDHKLLSQISSRWSGLLAQYLKQKLTYDFKWKWNAGQANIFDIRWL